jgi:putative hydrolase of the HAD superfamily
VALRGVSLPRALLLDALGTLVILDPPAARLRVELERSLQIVVDEAEAARAMGAEIAYYRANLDRGRDAASLAALRADCAEVMRGALPPSPELAAASTEALTAALLAALHFRAFPDARPALQAARERGLRVVVASNWDVSLHDVLARLGLDAWLTGIVTSAEAGARKPAPDVFARALEIAGVGAAEAVHVGDSFDEDVLGARRAGIAAVLIVRADAAPGVHGDGVRTIASLVDLFAAP